MLKRIVVGSTIAATSWYAFYRVTRWRAAWGSDPAERAMILPGDELVPGAAAVDTRAITIDAPPEAVWPWLVQMGYGRAGWYSYDKLDMKGRSADEILPEYQALAVGDMVPTDPGGGFVVRVLEPGRALVLGIDEEILARRDASGNVGLEAPGLAASGTFMKAAVPPEFRASWAFVLEPIDGGRTRLIERFRAWFGASTPISPAMGPLLDLGVFVMVRRQLLGIRERAERRPFSVGEAAAVAVEADATLAPEAEATLAPEAIGSEAPVVPEAAAPVEPEAEPVAQADDVAETEPVAQADDVAETEPIAGAEPDAASPDAEPPADEPEPEAASPAPAG
jgi:hypothetical protein